MKLTLKWTWFFVNFLFNDFTFYVPWYFLPLFYHYTFYCCLSNIWSGRTSSIFIVYLTFTVLRLYSKLTRWAIGSYLTFLEKKNAGALRYFFGTNINRKSIEIFLIRVLQTKLTSTAHKTNESDMTGSIWKRSKGLFIQLDKFGCSNNGIKIVNIGKKTAKS